MNMRLYHRIMRRENFKKAATDLFSMLKSTEESSPGAPRYLYVDIDGHRHDDGSFDSDMQELQTEFCRKILAPYFTEIHFPLVTYKNPGEQRNDIPEGLEFFNAENEVDDSLNKLYIENYSNTEFMSEEPVYNYLEKVSSFLKKYNKFAVSDNLQSSPAYDPCGWLKLWRSHMDDLINELFTVFLYGNLLSAAAMTRTLIECFVYYTILVSEESEALIDEWFICSLFCSGISESETLKNTVKDYCAVRGLDFEQKWTFYAKSKRNPNVWLSFALPHNRLSFSAACDHIGSPEIYRDYQRACAFVHGQDISSKVIPFAFYQSVFSKMHMMMYYIFETLRLFGLNDELDGLLAELENGLTELANEYAK